MVRQTIGEKGKRGKKMAAVDSKTQRRLALNDILGQTVHLNILKRFC